MSWQGKLEKISQYKYRIPKDYKTGMRVEGVIFTDEVLLSSILSDKAPEQVANVAFLPGIVKGSFAMPDIHWGYGFPIGGVAATDPAEGGVVSPGGVGYDINCGVRLVRTNLEHSDIKDKNEKIIDTLYSHVPSGLGSKGDIKLSNKEEKRLLEKGAKWAVSQGLGVKEDVENCESNGVLEGADPDSISQRAYDRGKSQIGTLGSGNHFLEVQVVDQIFDQKIADVFGLFKGSRGGEREPEGGG